VNARHETIAERVIVALCVAIIAAIAFGVIA